MKKNMERLVKEALNQHQSPYTEGAWEGLSQHLATKKTFSSRVMWSIISGISAAAIVVIALIYSGNSENTIKPKQTSASTLLPSENEQKKSTPLSETQKEKESVLPQPKNSKQQKEPIQDLDPGFFQAPQQQEIGLNPDQTNEVNQYDVIVPFTQEPKTLGNEAIRELNLPKTLCLNEELVVSNPYKSKNITIKQSGKTTAILPGNKLKINTSEAGKIIVSHVKDEMVTILASKSKLSVDMDVSLMYENGIPSIKFIASGNQNSISWSSNVNSSETNQTYFVVHPYKERTVRVSAKSTDENGCTVEETKSVSINEPYNLLAVTGFKPASNDSRNNRFMPFALTQRETPFELVIFDPENGGVVFQSSDALNGWDGTDKRSGNMVKEASVWLWKVRMKSPNAGEPAEYTGTITRL